jgi:hypothetical protein
LGEVDEEVRILGVIDDVKELRWEQARVQGVAHRAHAGDGIVDFEVPMGVPGERRDAIAQPDLELPQGLCQLARASMGIAVGLAMDRTFDRPGHDLRVGVISAGVLDQRRDQQRRFHHQTLHSARSFSSMPSGTIRNLAGR